MNKRILFLVVLILTVISCGSRKTVSHKPNTSTVTLRNLTSKFEGQNSYQVKKILNDAEDFLGAPYKLGGTSKSGLDCSGLVIKVYNENKVKMPRRSSDQAQQGKKIEILNESQQFVHHFYAFDKFCTRHDFVQTVV